jgi:hypothetical protein
MPGPSLPFAHLNLRWNPFGELDEQTRVKAAVVDTETLVRHLGQPGRAVQLLGRCGRGKTTTLLALTRRVPDALYVRAWADRPLEIRPCGVLLLDEADTLSWWRRYRILRHSRCVALATHRDLTRSLRLAGLVPLTVRVGGVEEDRLHAMLNRRIACARRGAGPIPRIGRGAVRILIDRHGDDLRAMEIALYERFQALQEAGDVAV